MGSHDYHASVEHMEQVEKRRDLREDLGLFKAGFGPPLWQEGKITKHYLERAIKAEAKLTKIQRILREPAPFGAISEQLDQIREVVADE